MTLWLAALVFVVGFLAGGLAGAVLMCTMAVAKAADEIAGYPDGPTYWRRAVVVPDRPAVILPPSNPRLVEGREQEDEARMQAAMQAELARKWREDFDR